jgi:hypothetical protein
MEEKKPPQIKEPPVLYTNTQSDIAKLTTLLGAPVIAYWNNPRGSVCHNDVVAVYAILEKLGTHDTIYLFIKSGGGTGQASARLVSLLRQHCKRLVALVPLECASAATMITLGCNEIRMGPMAYLTAVDTSLNHPLSPVDQHNERVSVSLDELTRVIRLWQGEQAQSTENPYKALFQHVHPLVIGAVDRAESLSIMLCKQLLAYHISSEEAAARIAETLNGKYPSHTFPILFEEAKKIGLAAEALAPEVNALLLDLNERYSEMGQRATTDFDESRSHSNEILNIWEATDIQIYYQEDKDWFYRNEERRWITMNDNSSWRRVERQDGRVKKSLLHIA